MPSHHKEQINKVKKRVEEAKENTQKLKKPAMVTTEEIEDGWDKYWTGCPICGNDALLFGFTQNSKTFRKEDTSEERLEFFADTFQCKGCGLVLDDEEELRLAGIDLLYDRTDEFERWFHEKTVIK